MSRSELKANAKGQIKGKIGMFFLATLLIAMCNAFGGFVIVGVIIVTPALTIGETLLYLYVAKNEDAKASTIFDGFKSFWPAFKVIFLVGFYTMCWSMLFYIPGLIKSYSYSQALYIIAENPEMKANEAITKSRQIMDGHKMELFWLQLSFFWWYLLCGITFGIATIYVYPYIRTTMANFYLSVSGGSVSSMNRGGSSKATSISQPTINSGANSGAAFSAQRTSQIAPVPNGEPPKSTLPRSCLD